ncbi:MAG: hypothetical protein JJ979_19475 [Roseibium sp.]|nr:hypothetical protein [Roseibium sp.]
MKKARRTRKQKEIVNLVLKAADEGRELLFTELKQQLSYTACNAAINQAVENLDACGVIRKKKLDNGRVVLSPTLDAYSWRNHVMVPGHI